MTDNRSATGEKYRLFRNGLLLTGSNLLDKLLFFIINVIIARFLPVEQYGEYIAALEYATVFSALCDAGIAAAIIRFISRKRTDRKLSCQYFSTSLVLKSVTSCVMYVLMCSCLLLTRYNASTIRLILVMGVIRIAADFCSSCYAFYDAEESFSTSTYISMSLSLGLLGSTILVLFLNGNNYAIAVTRCIMTVLFAAWLFFFTIRKTGFSFNTGFLSKILRDALPFAQILLFYNIIGGSNSVLISNICGTTAAGFYSNAFAFIAAFSILPANLERVLSPSLYRISISDNPEKFQFTQDFFCRVTLMLSCFLALFLHILAPAVIKAAFGAKYLSSVPLLKLLAFTIPFLFNISFIIMTVIDMHAYRKKLLGIAALINISCGMLLIPRFQACGAAVSILVTYGFLYFSPLVLLGYRKTINVISSLISLAKSGVILLCIVPFYHVFLYQLPWIFSIPVLIFIYGILTYFLLFKKDDIRIIRESLFSK